MVDLIRRSAAERHVRAMAVVPRRKISKLAQKRSSPERHQRQLCDALLERQDQSLNHGNAAVLADRAEPRADALPLAPWFEFFHENWGPWSQTRCLGFAPAVRITRPRKARIASEVGSRSKRVMPMIRRQ
jgi:hypothetical protein